MQTPFLGPTYQSRSPNIACDRSINWYPELNPVDAKSIIAMIGTPGTYMFSHSAGNVIRGLREFNGVLYCVAGSSLFSIDSSGVASPVLASLNTSTGRVYMSDNGIASAGVGGNQLIIVDGVKGYIYNVITSTFGIIPNTGGFPLNPTGVTYIDGYFVVINDTMSYWVSDLYDGLTWNALATSPVSAYSGNVLGVVNLHQQLWFIKEFSAEVWYDAGTPTSEGSPFLRISGAVIDYGTKAPATIAQWSNGLFFLAWERSNDGGEPIGIVQMNGYAPVLISTVAINYRISQLAGASTGHTDAFGYCYIDEGHEFYVITFPTGDATFVYDVTTQMWHERSTFTWTVPSGYTFGLDDGITFPPVVPPSSVLTQSIYAVHRHIGNCYAYYCGKHLVGDWASGNVYEMSSAYFEDNGMPIVSVRIGQHIWDKKSMGNVMIHKLQIDAETGIGEVGSEFLGGAGYLADGTYTADGTIYAGAVVTPTGTMDPQAILSWSNDSGRTWSGDYRASMGAVGDYKRRLIWRRLGKSRDRVFRLALSNTPKRNIIGAYIEATG